MFLSVWFYLPIQHVESSLLATLLSSHISKDVGVLRAPGRPEEMSGFVDWSQYLLKMSSGICVTRKCLSTCLISGLYLNTALSSKIHSFFTFFSLFLLHCSSVCLFISQQLFPGTIAQKRKKKMKHDEKQIGKKYKVPVPLTKTEIASLLAAV